ncbi:DMT family transporter [Roseofilum capinflatum]|uniref:DMT family transporter n=1 Tax=Roseofilum capinflatum BLCC-M114 TaxID=3022440 RepID=A0ABT7B4A2_9CYAN|nr:DMT family transporter [Roseofilum capinflatum]MDJ1173979.1 DMT family transporter [Roseofilum capinflatum BLCC-M114]
MKKPAMWWVGLVLGFGVLTIATSAVFVRLCLEAAGRTGAGFSLVVAVFRLVIASLLCVPLWKGVQNSGASRQAWKWAIAAGLCLAVHFSLWITSLSYTSIAAATTLVTTNPLWVALMLWVWQGKRPTQFTILGILIALTGGILIAFGGDSATPTGSLSLLGNALALMGAWSASFYLILGQQAQQEGLGLGHYIATVYTLAALCLFPIPFLLGVPYTGYPLDFYLYVALMAILPQLMGHTSLNWAVRWISPTTVALAILCEPIGATWLGYVIFAEVPTPLVFGGAIILLLGVALAIWGEGKRSQNY